MFIIHGFGSHRFSLICSSEVLFLADLADFADLFFRGFFSHRSHRFSQTVLPQGMRFAKANGSRRLVFSL